MNAKPTDQRREISDGRGLYLVIQPSGAKSWALRYRRKADRRARKVTFDGPLSLIEARAKAAEAMRQVKDGGDPAAAKVGVKAAAKQAAADRAVDSVEKIVADFIKLYASRNRSRLAIQGIFSRDVLPKWKGRTIHDISKRDVLALINTIAVNKPIQANRIFAALRRLFNWCIEQAILTVSPCTGVKPPSQETSRDRVLSDSEIVALWNATDADRAGPILRMLLLTGQRRDEVRNMRWTELNEAERLWTLPPARTKNKTRHDVPLSRQAWSIIESMPPIAGNDFVFATADRGGLARAKTRIDKLMPGVEHWTLHDLRRTCATGLQKLGVRLEVNEAIMNHISGTRSGIAGIYQRHTGATKSASIYSAGLITSTRWSPASPAPSSSFGPKR